MPYFTPYNDICSCDVLDLEMAAVVCIHLGRLCLFLSLFLMQDKLEQELEAVKAERMRAAIQAAADRQLADAQQQVYKENPN